MRVGKVHAIGLLALGMSLLVGAGAAQATPIQVTGDIITRVTNGTTAVNGSDPSVNALSSFSDSASIPGIGSASATAVVTPGTLMVGGTATHIADGSTSDSQALVNVTVADFATVGAGSAYAPGTPITVTLTISLGGTHSAIDNSSGGSYGMDVVATERIVDETLGTSTIVTYSVAFGTGALTGTFAGVVGENVIIDTSISLLDYVAGNSPIGTSSTDYTDPVNYYLDTSLPGVDVIGSTGHDYATPTAPTSVPEPSSLALTILPLTMLGATLWRRERRRVLVSRAVIDLVRG
jgi:hypothetical protein